MYNNKNQQPFCKYENKWSRWNEFRYLIVAKWYFDLILVNTMTVAKTTQAII